MHSSSCDTPAHSQPNHTSSWPSQPCEPRSSTMPQVSFHLLPSGTKNRQRRRFKGDNLTSAINPKNTQQTKIPMLAKLSRIDTRRLSAVASAELHISQPRLLAERRERKNVFTASRILHQTLYTSFGAPMKDSKNMNNSATVKRSHTLYICHVFVCPISFFGPCMPHTGYLVPGNLLLILCIHVKMTLEPALGSDADERKREMVHGVCKRSTNVSAQSGGRGYHNLTLKGPLVPP
jgi:hypothetical protein